MVSGLLSRGDLSLLERQRLENKNQRWFAVGELDDIEEIDLSSPMPTKAHLIKRKKSGIKRGPPLTRFPKWKQELYASMASSPKKPITLKTKGD